MSKVVLAFCGAASASMATYGGLVALSRKGSSENTEEERENSFNGSVQQMMSGAGGKPVVEKTQTQPGGGDVDQKGKRSEIGTSITSPSGPGTEGGTAGGVGAGPSKVSEAYQNQAKKEESSENQLTFESVNKFKTKLQTSPCVKDLFEENSTWDTTAGKDIEGENKPTTEEFFKDSDQSEEFKSCLIINWKKTASNSGDKWTGKFTWLWTFKRGNEGFINFNIAEPSSEEGKLKLTGVFYLVKKEDSTWNINYKKEISDQHNKQYDEKNLDSKFPKKGQHLKTDSSIGNAYWNFIQKPEDLKSMCKAGNESCSKGTSKSEIHTFQWTFQEGGASKEAKSWSGRLDWWKHIYGLDNYWNLKDKTTNFKGEWKQMKPESK